MAQTELDCRGMNCPMPIVRVSRAVKDIAVGDTLAVTADDPSFQADIQAWIRMSGHLLHGITADGVTSTAVIERRK
jgi:tRNA 2-thiouridine synthesizing protein A